MPALSITSPIKKRGNMTISSVQILSPPAAIDDPSRSKTTTSKLANKIALVTGASKGIGASIGKHLGAAGATVIVNYATSQSGADKIVADIRADGGQATAIQGEILNASTILD